FATVREILKGMGIQVLSLPGFEADDLIGTLSLQCKQRGIKALIVTGDNDDLQLVDDGVHMLFTKRGISETVLFDPAGVKAYFGVTPEQVTDWKGLMGDSSDNIPGVPGVGEKTALKLLSEFGTLDNTLQNADKVKGKLGEKLVQFADQARMSRELATIRRDAPVTLSLKEAALDELAAGLPVLQKYQLNGASERLRRLTRATAPQTADGTEAPKPDWQEIARREELETFLTPPPEAPAAVFANAEELSLALPDGRRARLQGASRQQSLFEQADGLTSGEALGLMMPRLKGGFAAHDAKRLFHLMNLQYKEADRLVFDTMIAAYLNNPQEKSYALQSFAQRDAQGVMDLYGRQTAQLKEAWMEALFHDVELPLVRVLYDMEEVGFQVDAKVLSALGEEYIRRAEELREAVYRETGVPGFNLNSPQQLGKVLFETLKLPSQRKTKSGYSTDAEALEPLLPLHPSIKDILEYRQVTKLNSTYIDALLRKTDASGRIHTTFDQTGTSTGRISSNEPNLQNIPIRTEMGRDIRRAFVAKPGHVLIDADYSQIELRILAHMSGDEEMREAFRRDQDIHTHTAAEINGVELDEVTPAMRSDAKAINFGIVYGISDFGLARNIGSTRKRAADFISRYFEHYPGVRRFMDESVRFGYEHGYISTLMGRRRKLDELKSGNVNTRNFGERAAMNTPIQGTAADIIKAAMVRVSRELREGNFQARLILTVHDELIIEAPENEAGPVRQALKRCMEEVIALEVPLKCDIKTGYSWYDTK
ncbi:MAG: DNA polymerase I, partial [Clostridiales bacterium]|nr:DNA polymerase I [Clostridiales bacterium]